MLGNFLLALTVISQRNRYCDAVMRIYRQKLEHILAMHVHDILHTSSTAQGGGGSFKNRKPTGELVVVNHEWQSESTDGPKGGWSCVF